MPPRRRRTSPRLDPVEVEENLVNEAAANATPIPAAEVEKPAKPKRKRKAKAATSGVVCVSPHPRITIAGTELIAEDGLMTVPRELLHVVKRHGIEPQI